MLASYLRDRGEWLTVWGPCLSPAFSFNWSISPFFCFLFWVSTSDFIERKGFMFWKGFRIQNCIEKTKSPLRKESTAVQRGDMSRPQSQDWITARRRAGSASPWAAPLGQSGEECWAPPHVTTKISVVLPSKGVSFSYHI